LLARYAITMASKSEPERSSMKRVVTVTPERFAMIRREVMLDELRGVDPGASWARVYPGVTEIEFVVEDPLDDLGAALRPFRRRSDE
jgi:hypothetical protein